MINLTSDAFEDAHSTYMGLRFAEMGLEEGLDVTIFLNVDGVRLLQSDGATLTFDDDNLRTILDDITNNGGTVIVCPMCLQMHGMELSSIPSNFETGEAESMMNRIKNGPAVFTY
jgi:predicted peroxiredoxin